MENIIEIKDLCKSYESFKLDSINLSIPKGSIVGLIGENGAGKSTLINLLLGYSQKDSGSIKIFSKDISSNHKKIKEDIGVVLDTCCFNEKFNAKDISGILSGIYENWDENLYYTYLKKLNIPMDKKLETFSKGMLSKLSIITAISHNPKLLILDEATLGLDPIVRNEVLDIFLEFIQNEENSILLSSHITTDLEKIADYIAFIKNGKLLFFQNKDTLIEDYGVLKIEKEQLPLIDKEDIIFKIENKYSVEILCKNKSFIKDKYKNFTLDTTSLEEIMLFYLRGEQ